MLRSLKFLFLVSITILFFEEKPWACEAKLGRSLLEEKACKVKEDFTEDIQALQEKSSRHIETLTKDKDFNKIVSELEQKRPSSFLSTDNRFLVSEGAQASLYVFVSFSMDKKALLNLAKEASLYGATLVLKGFKENSHKKTVMALQKIIQETGQGFIVDPELFEMFRVGSVPSFILSYEIPNSSQDRIQTPLHDRLKGYVSLHYALERFSKEGDLKNEAKRLLEKRTLK